MKLKSTLHEAVKSRSFLALWSLMIIETVILLVLASIYIHAGQLQIPVRFSAFADTQYFREDWAYLLNFVVFGVAILCLNILVSLKLFNIKGRHFALGYLVIVILVFAVSILLIAAILRVAGIQ